MAAMAEHRTQHANHAQWQADEARDALAQALSAAGILLPAMDVRATQSEGGPQIDLGKVSAGTAWDLAEVIEKGTSA